MADLTPEEEFALYEAVDKENAAGKQDLSEAKLKLAIHLCKQDKPFLAPPSRVLLWNDAEQRWVEQDYE